MAFSNTGNSTATSVITSDDATSDIAAPPGWPP